MNVKELRDALKDLDADSLDVVLEIRNVNEVVHIAQTPLIDGIEVSHQEGEPDCVIITAPWTV